MLEAVINTSEGTDEALIGDIGRVASNCLLDVHHDRWHNRSVYTLAGEDVLACSLAVAATAIELLDLRLHRGAHPRLGVIDVVPFTPLGTSGLGSLVKANLDEALLARDEFARIAARDLGLSCFVYGPERSLVDIRRRAYIDLWPDFGPHERDDRKGACCVGARPALLAYNLWLKDTDLTRAQAVARSLRSEKVRALAFALGGKVQVSMNLLDPLAYGPAQAFDAVAQACTIARAELVGLIPEAVLDSISSRRWTELDLDQTKTVEARLKMLR